MGKVTRECLGSSEGLASISGDLCFQNTGLELGFEGCIDELTELHSEKAGWALVWRALDDRELKTVSLTCLPKVNGDLLTTPTSFSQDGGEKAEMDAFSLIP